MKNDKFFCEECHRIFDAPKFYNERRCLDVPPFERVAICPFCDGDEFLIFDTLIEKIEVAEKLIPAVMRLNRYTNSIKNIFGIHIKNNDLDDGVGMMMELIAEMLDFIDANTQVRLLKICNENDVDKILMYLRG